MKIKELKRILQITIAPMFVLSVIGLLYADVNLLTLSGLKKLSPIITILVLFWIFYLTIGWKLPILKYIVYKENLNGTWYGKYDSRDILNNKNYKGEIAIVIRQTFLTINVKSFTDKYLAYSFGETLLKEEKSDSKQLVYLYSQNQFNPTDKLTRKGASELHLTDEDDNKKLFGIFWTNYNSEGNLSFIRVSKKHVKSFAKAKQFNK